MPVPEPTEAELTATVAPSVPTPALVPVVVATPTQSAGVTKDVPLMAADILLYIIAQKLKKRVEEVPLTKSIKDLVGRKSTLQKEILGDLQLEFTSTPEKGEELPLEELGSALGVGILEPSANIRPASSHALLVERCPEVSTPPQSRATCQRPGVWVPRRVLMVFFC